MEAKLQFQEEPPRQQQTRLSYRGLLPLVSPSSSWSSEAGDNPGESGHHETSTESENKLQMVFVSQQQCEVSQQLVEQFGKACFSHI